MNPENFSYFKSKVSKFISGSSSRPLFGGFGSSKVTRFSRFIPKRSVPSQVLSTPSTSQDDAEVSRGVVPSLGRLTLNLEVVNNNLDRIKDIIINDYKENQEATRKEIDDYRKRIANRGRIFGRRELGDKKSDVLGAVRKYVGSFFSGTGGAIRALSAFNLLQGLLTGDPSKIIGPLLGIGITYLPAIGGAIGTAVATSLIGRLFGGGGRVAAGAAQGAAPAAGAGRLGGLARFGGRAALVGGGLALASSIFNRPEGDSQQQRLEDLTQQQKGLVDSSNLVPVPQDDLKRFERLNKKFEEALDFLLGKQKGQPQQRTTPSGGGGGAPSPTESIPPGDFTGSANQEKAMNYFMSQGLTKEQSAGIVGNLMQESTAGLDPNADNGSHHGIAQWDKQVRWPRVKNYIESIGMNPNSIEGQLAGLRWEAGVRGDWRRIAQTKTAEESAVSFLENFERSGEGPGDPGYEARLRNAAKLIAGSYMSASSAPVIPPPVGASPRVRSPIGQTQQSPQVNVIPFTVPSGESSPTSDAVDSNDSTPSINTTHPENFLALYSKLMYQIV